MCLVCLWWTYRESLSSDLAVIMRRREVDRKREEKGKRSCRDYDYDMGIAVRVQLVIFMCCINFRDI